jgi:RNA polymerase primary sigma factor
MTDTLGDFLNRAGKTALLTAEEEILLSRQIQDWMQLRDVENPTITQKRVIRRGRQAYDRFFQANIKLAVYIAKQYTSKASSMSLDDLIQEGCVGLARGIEKFDPERGYKFSTYAYWWIRQSINRAIETQDRMIRLPINSLQQMAKARRFMLKYQIEHGRMPSTEMCCEVSGLSPETYKNCMLHIADCVSLDGLIQSTDTSRLSLIDLVADGREQPMEHVENVTMREKLATLQVQLTDKERYVLNAHYGLDGSIPQTYAQIGKAYQVSRESVRCFEQKAIRKMRYQATVQ